MLTWPTVQQHDVTLSWLLLNFEGWRALLRAWKLGHTNVKLLCWCPRDRHCSRIAAALLDASCTAEASKLTLKNEQP